MKAFITIFFLLFAFSGGAEFRNGRFVRGTLTNTGTPTAGGGAATWYDFEISANGDTAAGFNSGMHWCSKAPGQSGNCTKLRVYIKNRGGACDVKMALYTEAGALISGANGTASTVGGDQYLEVTLGTPAAVVNGTTYKIGWECENTNIDGWYKNGTANGLSFAAQDYSTFPPANLGTDLGPFNQGWVVGMYVE